MEFLVTFIIVYLTLNIWVIQKIKGAHYNSEERRLLHKTLIWVLPFFGVLLTRGFWKKTKEKELEVMTKAKRKFDKSKPIEPQRTDYQSFPTFWA